mmetsp:Transcript_15170/g.28521  ORF Transcript_15170/g.28521 Transcript_15170/m.28521 type:complete len:97 (+) Transcript_15170:400-690(+)
MSSTKIVDTSPTRSQEKISWISLSNIITQDNLAKLRRSESEGKRCKTFIYNVKREWVSVHDHILHTKFNYMKQFPRTSRMISQMGRRLWRKFPLVV